MAKNFNFLGRLKWIKTSYSKEGFLKAHAMLIPPNAGKFSKKVTFVEFIDDIALQISQSCTKDCFIQARGKYKFSGNKVKFTGEHFQIMEWNSELEKFVPAT